MGKVKEYFHDQIAGHRQFPIDEDDEYFYDNYLKKSKNEKTSQRNRNSRKIS